MLILHQAWKKIAILLLLTITLAMLFPVGAETDASLVGNWVYKDLPEKTVIILQEDGVAVYGSSSYQWARTEGGILLTGEDGSSAELRCEQTEDGMILWLPTIYERTAGTDGLLGLWKAGGTSMSEFIFATNGQFREDGVFTGDYFVDEALGQITLKYIDDSFDDTVIDYFFMDDYLVIGYPWSLIRK